MVIIRSSPRIQPRSGEAVCGFVVPSGCLLALYGLSATFKHQCFWTRSWPGTSPADHRLPVDAGVRHIQARHEHQVPVPGHAGPGHARPHGHQGQRWTGEGGPMGFWVQQEKGTPAAAVDVCVERVCSPLFPAPGVWRAGLRAVQGQRRLLRHRGDLPVLLQPRV